MATTTPTAHTITCGDIVRQAGGRWHFRVLCEHSAYDNQHDLVTVRTVRPQALDGRGTRKRHSTPHQIPRGELVLIRAGRGGCVPVVDILALGVGREHDGLIVCHRQWTAGTLTAQAREAIDGGADTDQVLGRAVMAVLTADGRHYDCTGWCGCPDVAHEDWVRFQRWSNAGLDAHGYACRTCRKILQTG